jgi:hypothetical protein
MQEGFVDILLHGNSSHYKLNEENHCVLASPASGDDENCGMCCIFLTFPVLAVFNKRQQTLIGCETQNKHVRDRL